MRYRAPIMAVLILVSLVTTLIVIPTLENATDILARDNMAEFYGHTAGTSTDDLPPEWDQEEQGLAGTSADTIWPVPAPPSGAATPPLDTVAQCAAEIKDIVRESNLNSTVKDLFELSLQRISDKGRDSYLRSLLSRPMRVRSADHVRRAREQIIPHCPSLSNTTIAICAIQSSMGPFLQEWLMHYWLLGVSKVYMLSDHDEWPDVTAAALRPFVEAGFVAEVANDAELFNSTYAQMDFYNYCVATWKDEYDFLSFLDVDEFFIAHRSSFRPPTADPTALGLLKPGSKLPPAKSLCMTEFMDHYEQWNGVVIPWRIMSIAGVLSNDPGKLLIEEARYHTFKAGEFPQVKTIFRGNTIERLQDPHRPMFINDTLVTVNPFKRIEYSAFMMNYDTNLDAYVHAELRHYWGLSWLHTIYFKICGSSPERQFYRKTRIKYFLSMVAMKDAHRSPRAPDRLVYNLRRALDMG